MSRSTLSIVSGILASIMAASVALAQSVVTDTGTLDKDTARRSRNGRTRPMPAAISRFVPSSATRICTRRCRWTPARSAAG